jgi:hypothetical protein
LGLVLDVILRVKVGKTRVKVLWRAFDMQKCQKNANFQRFLRVKMAKIRVKMAQKYH